MARRPRLLAAGSTLAAAAIAAAAVAAVLGEPAAPSTVTVEIVARYSAFSPAEIVVPAGVAVTIKLVNEDPIDHEWIVGDAATHAIHRVGTEPLHPSRPEEVVMPAMTTATTTVTFDEPGDVQFICHLPGHEAYGMVGTFRVVPRTAIGGAG